MLIKNVKCSRYDCGQVWWVAHAFYSITQEVEAGSLGV